MILHWILIATVCVIVPTLSFIPAFSDLFWAQDDPIRSAIILATVGLASALGLFLLENSNFNPFSLCEISISLFAKFADCFSLFTLRNFAFKLRHCLISFFHLCKLDLKYFIQPRPDLLPSSISFEDFGKHKVRKQFIFFAYIYNLFDQFFSYSSNFYPQIFLHRQISIFRALKQQYIYFCLVFTAFISLIAALIFALYHNRFYISLSFEIYLFTRSIRLTSWNITNANAIQSSRTIREPCAFPIDQ